MINLVLRTDRRPHQPAYSVISCLTVPTPAVVPCSDIRLGIALQHYSLFGQRTDLSRCNATWCKVYVYMYIYINIYIPDLGRQRCYSLSCERNDSSSSRAAIDSHCLHLLVHFSPKHSRFYLLFLKLLPQVNKNSPCARFYFFSRNLQSTF